MGTSYRIADISKCRCIAHSIYTGRTAFVKTAPVNRCRVFACRARRAATSRPGRRVVGTMRLRGLLAAAVLAGVPAGAGAVTPFGGPVVVGHGVIAGHPVSFLKVRLGEVRVRVGLAGGRPGRVETLDEIARRYRAVAAINGGDFEAYGDAAIRNPNHTLITGGGLLFKGDVGDVLWFDRDDHAEIVRMPLKIEGALDGKWTWPNNWYAYWINRYPSGGGDTITIFTPEWGERTGLSGGPQIQVTHGGVTVNPAAEGFRDPKILYLSAARSAVGITRDGTTLIMATSGGTIRQMADVMRGLGAYQAMAFDGGASAGLWMTGHYITEPGRLLNNALLVLSKQRSQ